MSERLSSEETEAKIKALVGSRYPYEVLDALDGISHPNDLAVVVGAALARTLEAGRIMGAEDQRTALRERLGL